MATRTVKRRVFTARDFDSFKERILSHLKAKFPTTFSDLYESHFAIMAVEMAAKLADDMMFYLEHQYNELYIDTVGERRNMRSICKLIDYSLRNRTAATVLLSCTCNDYAPNSLTIRKGTVVPTRVERVNFYVIRDYSFSGDNVFEIEAIEGNIREDTFIASGQTSQEYITMFNSVVDNVEVEVFVDGTKWELVDSLWEVQTGNYYEKDNTDDMRVRVLFGDGTHGNIPPSGATILIKYGTGVGSLGNISAGKISTYIQGELSGPPNILSVSVNNDASPASGGDDEETVDEARINAPLSLKALRGLVTRDDYKGYCLSYPGVLAASIEIDNIFNLVTAYIVANGYQPPGPSLIQDLKDDLTRERVVGLIIDVKAPVFVYIDLGGTVTVKDTYSLVDVERETRLAIQEFFQPTDIHTSDKDFGQDVRLSDVIALIDGVEGVDYVDLTKLARAPVISLLVWHSATAEFRNVNIGDTAKEEVWSVKALTYTTFQVFGSYSGMQQNIGTVNVPYVTDKGEISFTLWQGADPLEAGDVARIKTSAYLGNVDVDPGEFALQGNVNLLFRYEPLGVVS